MKGKFMIIAALLGALTFGACVDSEESASVTAVRNAKAEQLKSVATLNNAKAQAETTIAAAEAALLQAQAQKAAAEAAAQNAQTEAQKIANQVAAAKAEAEIAAIEAQLELDMLAYQTALLEAKAAFVATADANMIALYTAYSTDLEELTAAKANLASLKAKLAKAEQGLVDIEATHNKSVADAQAKLASLEAEKAGYEAALAQVKEWSEYDMSYEQMVEYLDDFYPNYRAAVLKQTETKKASDAANKAYNDHFLKVLSGTATNYKYYKSSFELYSAMAADFQADNEDDLDYIVPTWKNNIAYDHDGDKAALDNLSTGATAPLTSNGFVNSKGKDVAVYLNLGILKSVSIDNNGKYTSSSSKWSYDHILFIDDVIADGVTAYEAEALAQIEAYYKPLLAKMEVDVAAAKSAFEKKNEDKVSEKTQMEARIADWAKVVEAKAKWEKQLAENQAIIASYVDVDDMPTASDDEILDSDDYNGDYDYSYYKASFNIVKNALAKVEEAESWLYDFDYDAYSAQKNWVKGLKSVDTDGEALYDEDDCVMDIHDDLVGYFNSKGEYVDSSNSYLALVAAEAALKANKANNIEYVALLVECLNGMIAEYENWVAFAITKTNELAKAKAEAAYVAAQNANAVANFEAKYEAIKALVDSATVAGDSTTGAKAYEFAYGDEIVRLQGEIAKVNDKIKAQKAIIESKLANKITTQEALIAELKEDVVLAEYEVAVAEANLATSKAALDAALAE